MAHPVPRGRGRKSSLVGLSTTGVLLGAGLALRSQTFNTRLRFRFHDGHEHEVPDRSPGR